MKAGNLGGAEANKQTEDPGGAGVAQKPRVAEDFTVVTPSYRQLDWLACCIASVADQQGVTVEHIVQDAGTEGFKEFAKKMQERWPDREGYRRVMISETDTGMYDAINQGLKRGGGRICAYLNCDEQYLPGVLAQVKEEFARQAQAEILYGGFLVVDERGELVTAQKPVRMFWPHVATSHLPNFTCATFFLRSMLEREQAWFDPSYRACGDAAWTVERLKARIPSQVSPGWFSVFTEGAGNQGIAPAGLVEAGRIRGLAPSWVRAGAPAWKLAHRIIKILSWHYRRASIRYKIFTKEEASTRTEFYASRVNPVWKARLLLGR